MLAVLLLLQFDAKLLYLQVSGLSCSSLLRGDSRFQVVSRMRLRLSL